MPKLQYGLSQIGRDRGNLPELPVINMFVEEYPTEEAPVLQSRPGLETTGSALGAGPVTAVFTIDGVLSGEYYALSGGALYKNGTSVGTVVGTGPAKIVGFENRVFANAGGALYNYDGATFAAVTTPGSFNVRSMCIGSSRVIVIDDGTGQFYWSNVLSTTVDALSFATAEYSPDSLKECLFIGDTLHLFGSETVEFWPSSSANPDLPWQPLVGRTFSVGIRDTGCACPFATTFAWITNHNQVCVGDPQNVISTSSLDEKLTNSTTAKLWTFYLDGTEFLAVRLDTETWVFSKTSSQWSTFASDGETNWIPQCYTAGKFGSSTDGYLLQWATTHDDFGGILERRFRAGISIANGTVPLYNVCLKANPGRTPYTTGDYATPEISLRTSMDAGENWGSWKTISLGIQNEFRQLLRWTSLGFFGNPGILVEVKVTDPVPFRVSDMVVNDELSQV